MKRIFKYLGIGLIISLIIHERKTLFEIKKSNLEFLHRMKNPKAK